ncbi:pectate lyase [Horticoccus luteus]|uniref:Pectate lyase n=1 Tax=Horticoccus luteus TaxID=2862869 RepID=A0A8F9XK75_9BACT|nr:pectate lyase [Horticoccus luteus]QYM77799.1 pectate lyase [Horticoccus luteus]
MRFFRPFLSLLLLSLAAEARAAVAWRAVLRQPAAWYASAEARAVGESVLLYQTPSGGWPKNHDMTRPPGPAEFADHENVAPTIDNDATWTQIRLLARIDAGQPEPRFRAAALHGLNYLLAAQYPNGGWPQYFPLRPGYYTRITFNDDAMVGVLATLRPVARGDAPFQWADAALRARCAEAVQRGVACILRCQIVVNGRKTVWCAQHDELTFEPAPARKYEHVSLSGLESVGIVRFLMGEENPSPEVIDAVRSAVAWFETSKLTGQRLVERPDPALPHGHDRAIVADPHAPPLWARFYEIGTNRPIFGGRDTLIHYTLAEVEPERRGGYRWYVNDPAALLARDYPQWAARWLKTSS